MKMAYLFFPMFLSSIIYLNAQDSKVFFKASDTTAVNAFNWAKRQALNYTVFNDRIGDWYNANYPGSRGSAYCIRNLVQQSMGAHILGLDNNTKNMLRRIAAEISQSKDWCSCWCMNRWEEATYVDYTNDEAFRYYLPANFDFIDCCYRMFLWTGDCTYITDSVFLNFYRRTVYDYVKRWDLSINKIMKRERIMNVSDNFDPNSRLDYQFNILSRARGIPGYDETNVDYTLSLEQLVIQYSGYLAYARIQEFRGDYKEADKFLIKAQRMLSLINTVWWDKKKQSYYFYLDKNRKLLHDHSLTGSPVLFGDAANPSKLKVLIDTLTREVMSKPHFGNIDQSKMCRALYRYGISEPAYDLLRTITLGIDRTYPEMSFTAIEAIASGLMGIEMEVHSPNEPITNGEYVERNIVTTSRLPGGNGWAELDHMPIRSNDITVRHEGLYKTVMTNNTGPGVIWKAKFNGSFDVLLVNDYAVKTTKGVQYLGGPMMSWVIIEVAPGESVTVKTNE
jgi:hypothetical protein